MQIENKTLYNEDVIKEGCKILTRRYICVVAAEILLFLVLIGYFVFAGGVSENLIPILILIVGIGLVSALGTSKVRDYKKTMIKRLQVITNQDSVWYNYTIDEEKITLNTENASNVLYHRDIKKLGETENLYVIIYVGKVSVFLSKAGFEANGIDDFKELMKSHL